jgi:hypothetical protein
MGQVLHGSARTIVAVGMPEIADEAPQSGWLRKVRRIEKQSHACHEGAVDMTPPRRAGLDFLPCPFGPPFHVALSANCGMRGAHATQHRLFGGSP